MASVSSPLLRKPPALEMFGCSLRFVWLVLAFVTIMAEVAPVAGLPVAAFYTYKASKIALFLLLGYLTPLCFHRFDRLNAGLLLASVTTAGVEMLQGLIGNGHRLSVVELMLKLLLILLGFAAALDARYERAISIGPLRIRLASSEVPTRNAIL